MQTRTLRTVDGRVVYEAEVQNSVDSSEFLRMYMNENNGGCPPTMTKLNLDNKYLEGIDFSDVNLYRSSFRNTVFMNCNFLRTEVGYVNFTGAEFGNCKLRFTNMDTAHFQHNMWYTVDQLGAERKYYTPLIVGAVRSDGYRFYATQFHGEQIRVVAGCQRHTVETAVKYWTNPDHWCRQESMAILHGLLEQAKALGWPIPNEELLKLKAACMTMDYKQPQEA